MFSISKNIFKLVLRLAIGSALLFYLMSCAKPPIREIATAEAALESARQAEAPVYAPETFKSAESMLDQAKNEMKAKEYDPARNSALKSQEFSNRAIDEARKNKAIEEARKNNAVQTNPTEKEKAAGPTLNPAEITIAELEAQKVGPAAMGEGIRISALEPIHFAFDDYTLTDKAREILTHHADWLKRYQNIKVLIEGHCDERGSNEYNIALGEKRAKSTRDYLAYLGVEADRFTIISYGEEIPVDPGHNETAWAKNRRAEFVVKIK
ncbi:MAG: peptidoglycan-associated lipoprotein Pal [bacterium]|nr:peptidoglycan-associated lipoprotein Pal [bacterium]